MAVASPRRQNPRAFRDSDLPFLPQRGSVAKPPGLVPLGAESPILERLSLKRRGGKVKYEIKYSNIGYCKDPWVGKSVGLSIFFFKCLLNSKGSNKYSFSVGRLIKPPVS